MADKKVTDEINLGNGYTDDTLMRVVESNADYKQRYGDLKTYIFSTNAISIAWDDFATAFTAGTLEPGRIYSIDMTSTGFNGQLFIQVDFLGAIDPLGTMIFTSAGNTKLLKVELAVYEGGIASYMFNYFHDPISNITWNGNPDNNGSKGHDFFNAVMSVGEVGDGNNYENIVVNFGAQFEGGYPVVAKNFTFNTGILNFANSTDITLLRGSTAILTAVTVFSAATTITGGQIGGRGCSASNDTTIDLVGNNDLNFANYPLCGKQTITNVDIAGLSIISGWASDPANYGAEILVCGAFGISIGTGKILCGTNTSVTSGGTFATVNQWAKFLLHSDSNAYLLDYI